MGLFIPASEPAFWVAKKAIGLYELAFGAKLNDVKSIIIPFNVHDIPLWLLNFGCRLGLPRTIQRYLEAPWGCAIAKAELFDFCLVSISKKLQSWVSCLLSFMRRTLLIRHILQAIPIFAQLTKGIVDALYRLFRSFLWGYSEGGGKKIPFVAWK